MAVCSVSHGAKYNQNLVKAWSRFDKSEPSCCSVVTGVFKSSNPTKSIIYRVFEILAISAGLGLGNSSVGYIIFGARSVAILRSRSYPEEHVDHDGSPRIEPQRQFSARQLILGSYAGPIALTTTQPRRLRR